MLDPRLLYKRLDVRIKGTTRCLFHNGTYEDADGFTVLTGIPKNTDTSIFVKVGFEQSRIRFPLRFLFPEMTTQRPFFVPLKLATPVVSTYQQRVVIIGPDCYDKLDLVGNYGRITNTGYSLASDQAYVMVTTGLRRGEGSYFHGQSLCRSHDEPVVWDGMTVL